MPWTDDDDRHFHRHAFCIRVEWHEMVAPAKHVERTPLLTPRAPEPEPRHAPGRRWWPRIAAAVAVLVLLWILV
jgi:hypothetical protein